MVVVFQQRVAVTVTMGERVEIHGAWESLWQEIWQEIAKKMLLR